MNDQDQDQGIPSPFMDNTGIPEDASEMPDDMGLSDAAANIGIQGMSDAVAQRHGKKLMRLKDELEKLFKDLEFTDEQKKEIDKNLTEAIAADMMTRLGERLTPDQIEELKTRNPQAVEDVAGFFKEKFAEDDIVEALAMATESVLDEFLRKVR